MGRRRVEPLHRCSRRRSGQDRGGVRQRGPRGEARNAGAARDRRADGAAGGGRHLRSRERPHHPLRRRRLAGAPEARSRRRAQRAARARARGDARRRRQLWNARRLLSRIRAGRLGGAADRATGQMDLRAPRVVPHRLPGARSRARGRAGPGRGWAVPGHARLGHVEYRRPHGVVRDAAEERRGDDQHLSRAGGMLSRPRGADQHRAHAAVSGHRAPGSHVRDGTADRSRLPAIRLRSSRAAPQESDPGAIAALCKSVRDDVRQRPLSSGHGDGAGARRMGRLCGPRKGSAKARQAPRHRRRQLCRHRNRGDARAHRDHGAPRRRARAGDRHDVERPGPRDQLCAADVGMARRCRRRRCVSSPAIPTCLRSEAARIPAAR